MFAPPTGSPTGGFSPPYTAPKRSFRAAYSGATLAHPLTQPYGLPVSPLVAAGIVAVLVVVTAFLWPVGRGRTAERREYHVASWEGPLTRAQVVTRALAAALLVLAVAAGRLGSEDELENLAPALVVGVAWPLLVLASITLGPVWRWLDPWDGAARLFGRDQGDEPAGHVWPAVVAAFVWGWYLSVYPDTLDPRAVGALLALYTLVTVAGSLAVGRRRWLSSAEPLGIVLSWMALLPRGRLGTWEPPRGAEALVGVLAGGVLFGALRRSELWGDLNTWEEARLVATAGLLASCAAFVGLLVLMGASTARPGDRAAAVRAGIPALAGIIVAVALDRNRFFTSAQLLPQLFGDPFGRGWDVFGRAGEGLDPDPLGTRGLIAAQAAVVAAGFLAAAVVQARRFARGTRAPRAVGLAILAGAATVALASH